MFRQWRMTGLARYSLVNAFARYLEDLGVATLANLMAGVGNRERRNLADGVTAIVPVLTETAWNEESTRNQEQGHADQENRCQP